MCPLHGDIDALCKPQVKTLKKVDERPEVKRAATTLAEPKISEQYVHLLSGDLRMELKRKATWLSGEDVMRSELNLGTVYHHTIASNLLGPILKKRFKRTEQV